ncbi:MAG: alpha/beta fold hydrolase [Bdellovibrionales bacterium]
MKYFITLTLTFLLGACSSFPKEAVDLSISYNATLDTFRYPFPVKTFEIQTQRKNLQMRFMDIGKKDLKKIAILLHGKNFSGFYWEKIALELVSKNYRVVIPDQIGFGKSSKPDYYQYTFAQLSLNTMSLLDELGIKGKVHVVGHSMGGMLGVHLALNYEDRIKQLVLNNPVELEPLFKVL